MSLEGRVAVITGGASGIGRVVATELADSGADVAVNYLHSEREASILVKRIESMGRRAIAVKADVTSENQVAELVHEVNSHFDRIDILVNNVGDWLAKKVEETSLDEWMKILNTNVTATFLCSKHVLPFMRPHGWGRIVNIACAGAYRAHGTSGMSAFYAAKAGIVAFTKSLAREVGQDGITVNAVAPGVIGDKERTIEEAKKTKDKDTAIGRPGTSWDIAAAVLFLVSDNAGFITGDVMNVTGGWLV